MHKLMKIVIGATLIISAEFAALLWCIVVEHSHGERPAIICNGLKPSAIEDSTDELRKCVESTPSGSDLIIPPGNYAVQRIELGSVTIRGGGGHSSLNPYPTESSNFNMGNWAFRSEGIDAIWVKTPAGALYRVPPFDGKSLVRSSSGFGHPDDLEDAKP